MKRAVKQGMILLLGLCGFLLFSCNSVPSEAPADAVPPTGAAASADVPAAEAAATPASAAAPTPAEAAAPAPPPPEAAMPAEASPAPSAPPTEPEKPSVVSFLAPAPSRGDDALYDLAEPQTPFAEILPLVFAPPEKEPPAIFPEPSLPPLPPAAPSVPIAVAPVKAPAPVPAPPAAPLSTAPPIAPKPSVPEPAAAPKQTAPKQAAPAPAVPAVPTAPDPKTLLPAEPDTSRSVRREAVPMPSGPLPELPARTPPSVAEETVVFSRVVRATVGQLVEVPFRGNGWVYLGELGARKGLNYDSRRLDPEGQSYMFRAEAAGTYALKFYKQDFIQDFILNDHVQVIVGEAPVAAAIGGFSLPIDRGRVIAEPRWPSSTAPVAATQANPATLSSPAASAAAAQAAAATTTAPAVPAPAAATPTSGSSIASSAVGTPAGTPASGASASTTSPGAVAAAPAAAAASTRTAASPTAATAAAPAASTAAAAPTAGSPAAARATAGSASASAAVPAAAASDSGITRESGVSAVSAPAAAVLSTAVFAPDAQPQEYLAQARKEYDAGKIGAALGILDSFRDRFPAGSDEAWWLYGQLLEANSPSKDIKSALGFYRRLLGEYPLSNRYEAAKRRIAYLEQFYFNIR